MASMNLDSGRAGGDGDCYTSPARPPGSSLRRITIERREKGELSPPVASVTSPASSSSSFIQEQIAKASTDRYPPETESCAGEPAIGCQHEGSGSGGGGGGDGGGNAAVWSGPSNVVEVVAPVLSAVSWPAFVESTKPTAKPSSSSASLQPLSDGSLLPALQVSGNSSPSSQKPASVDPTSTPNYVTHSGQRWVRRGGGNSGASVTSNRGVSQQSPENQGPKDESQSNLFGIPATAVNSSYPTDYTPRGGFGSRPNSGSDHHYQRNSYRRGNGGPHPPSDGSYHRIYGGRLDQGQGQGHWIQQRNISRNPNMHSQRVSYIRPSVHYSTQIVAPPMHLPAQPLGNNVLYPDVAPAMIYFQSPPVRGPLYFPAPNPLLEIVNQINFYFSYENLVTDTYLRRRMDEQGWVPVSLIAGFNKISRLTDNVQLILNLMQNSTVVEVQGDQMRPRNDWMRWPIPPAVGDPLGL